MQNNNLVFRPAGDRLEEMVTIRNNCHLCDDKRCYHGCPEMARMVELEIELSVIEGIHF